MITDTISKEEYELRLRGFQIVRDILIRESESNPQLNHLYEEWMGVLKDSIESEGREEFHWHTDIDRNNTEGLSQLEFFSQMGYHNEIEIRGTLLILQFLMEWKRGNYTKSKEVFKQSVIPPKR
jgi:hypothetical protein